MSYVVRRGLFDYLDESNQIRCAKQLNDFISEKKRAKSQIYFCLNEIGYLMHRLQVGTIELVHELFATLLKYSGHHSHAIRNRSAQCLAI